MKVLIRIMGLIVGRKILLFQTVGLEVMDTILSELKINDELYLILPAKANIPKTIKKYKHIVIRTGKKYIDYQDIYESKRIPRVHYDEVWIPSSAADNYDEFAEIYACLTDVKFEYFIWIGQGKKIEYKNTLNIRTKEKVVGKIVNWWFAVFYIAEKMDSYLKGYVE